MVYVIEHKIQTFAENAVMGNPKAASFSIEGIEFVHWDVNITHGWLQDSWLATAKIEAENYQEAFRSFRTLMRRLIPRISLISQCYIDSVSQPFLIVKNGADVGFFRHTKDVDPVGLMFMEKQFKALAMLCRNTDIAEEFYSTGTTS